MLDGSDSKEAKVINLRALESQKSETGDRTLDDLQIGDNQFFLRINGHSCGFSLEYVLRRQTKELPEPLQQLMGDNKGVIEKTVIERHVHVPAWARGIKSIEGLLLDWGIYRLKSTIKSAAYYSNRSEEIFKEKVTECLSRTEPSPPNTKIT